MGEKWTRPCRERPPSAAVLAYLCTGKPQDKEGQPLKPTDPVWHTYRSYPPRCFCMLGEVPSAGTLCVPMVCCSIGANGANLSHQVKLGNLELYVEQESVPSTWYFLIALPVLLAIVIVGKCPVSFCPRSYLLRLLSG